MNASNQQPGHPVQRGRVFLVAALLLLVPVALLTGWFRQASSDDLCSNKIISQTVSPNGSSKIVSFVRDCGATTSFSVQAALLPVRDPLPANPNSVFVADDDRGRAPIHLTGVPNVIIRWRDARSVLVQYPSLARVFRADTSSSGVQIHYAPTNG
jgi:hypothetical protein